MQCYCPLNISWLMSACFFFLFPSSWIVLWEMVSPILSAADFLIRSFLMLKTVINVRHSLMACHSNLILGSVMSKKFLLFSAVQMTPKDDLWWLYSSFLDLKEWGEVGSSGWHTLLWCCEQWPLELMFVCVCHAGSPNHMIGNVFACLFWLVTLLSIICRLFGKHPPHLWPA